MEQCKIIVVLFALISLSKAVVAEPNFQHALDLINDKKPDIDYDQFCVQKPEGEEHLIACRIKDEPTVGLIVCKADIVDGAACQDVVNIALKNHAKLRDSTPVVRTVEFLEQPIDGLNCEENPAQTCSGFLEGWVDLVVDNKGRFEHIRNAIVKNKVPALIRKVTGYTSNAGLAATATDLMTIKTFMEADGTKYRQICDLQGFFLLNGGFLVIDVHDIRENLGPLDRCWEDPTAEYPEPTTQEVLTALDDMISAFKK